MAIEDLVNAEVLNDLMNQISSLTTLFQAVGGFIIAYIIFNIINLIISRSKKKQFEQLAKDVGEIKRMLRKK